MKVFTHRPKRAGEDFKKELRILNELRKYPHNHIVTHDAAFTQDDQDCMLFPYAQYNLREYMKWHTFDLSSKQSILWFLEQLRGLSHALYDLHNISDAHDSGPKSNLTVPTPEDRKSGWHHDIKPENILFYLIDGAKHGTFRMADFGSGKVQTYRSGSVNTASPNGTLTYEPPEAWSEGVTSRPYDVWSLGCVFMELLIWALLGNQDVEKFTRERVGRRVSDSKIFLIHDDGFWQTSEGTPLVFRLPVEKMVQRLQEAVKKSDSQHFFEVVNLIIRMLDLNRRTRITALDLYDTLDRICKQKKIDLANNDASPSDQFNLEAADMPRLDLKEPDRRIPELPAEQSLSPSDAMQMVSLSSHRKSLSGGQYMASPAAHRSPLAMLSTQNSPRQEMQSRSPTHSRNISRSSTGAAYGSPRVSTPGLIEAPEEGS